MNNHLLLKYLHKNIPITKSMDLSILEASDGGVRIHAGLSANINHKKTAFGGSISTLLILVCWSYVKLLLEQKNISGEIVIQKSKVEFLRPIQTDFSAFCPPPSEEKMDIFINMLEKKGKSRMGLTSYIGSKENPLAVFNGDFVTIVQ